MRSVRDLARFTFVLMMLGTLPGFAHGEDAFTRLQEARRDWLEAVDNRDVDAIVSGFAEGAVIMPKYVAPRLGKAAIREWYETNFARNDVHYDYVTHAIEIDGDWAFEEWSVTVTVAPGVDDMLGDLVDPGQFSDSGVRVYRRTPGGEWKIDREVWSGGHPATKLLSSIFSSALSAGI